MKPNIGITADHLKKITTIISSVLADGMMVYIKTRKFHWNVSGESFMEYHKLFEAQYTEIEEEIDEVAERISKLGGMPIGTAKEFSSLSQIKENPGVIPSSLDMVKELLADHESIIISLRKAVDECADKLGDAGTSDFLTNIMEDHETLAWQLRRYLK